MQLNLIKKANFEDLFPIWAMEFGADYPFEGKAPIKLRKADLEGKKGTFGKISAGHLW